MATNSCAHLGKGHAQPWSFASPGVLPQGASLNASLVTGPDRHEPALKPPLAETVKNKEGL